MKEHSCFLVKNIKIRECMFQIIIIDVFVTVKIHSGTSKCPFDYPDVYFFIIIHKIFAIHSNHR